jgi:hypothetical protein
MNLPVPVVVTMNGDAVVAGGTNRSARVLDSRTSETTQLLPHDGMFNRVSAPLDSTQARAQVISFKPLYVFPSDLTRPP